MEELSIREILKATGGVLVSGNINSFISDICLNSSNVTKNSLFIPIKGENVDAHDFIQDAFSNGAIATLIQRNLSYLDNGIYIYVDSTFTAFQNIVRYYRSKLNIPIIGVTGSVGKTSTKEMIAAALSSTLNILKTFGNMNSQIGLPLTILGIENNHDIAVVEMGMSEFGEMSRIANVARVNYAVITNIGVSHIENLGTRENIRDEKLHIKDYFNKDKDVLFLNADDDLLYSIKDDLDVKIITFSINSDADYIAEDIEYSRDKTVFYLKSKMYEGEITIPAIGKHNVYNALAAIAVSFMAGLNIYQIKQGLLSYKSAPMRQQIHELNDVTIIDDSYNASPDSIKSGIDVLNRVKNNKGKTIAVLADMLELGDYSSTEHFNLGKYIAIENVQYIITIGEKAKNIANGAKAINDNINTFSCSNNMEAIDILNSILEKNDTVLIKGSRGMHTEQVVEALLDKYRVPSIV